MYVPASTAAFVMAGSPVRPEIVVGPVALRVQSVAVAVPPPVLSTNLVSVTWAGGGVGSSVGSIAPAVGTTGVNARAAVTTRRKAPKRGPARRRGGRELWFIVRRGLWVPVAVQGDHWESLRGEDHGTPGVGVGPRYWLRGSVYVGSWQSWHVPRLSTFRSRLSPVDPPIE